MTSAEEPPGTLEESVDWMTYPHAELYRMVHEGLDLAGATTVSADWARMGEALGEIGDELNKIVQAFADAWEGDAAEQAQHAVESLGTWAQESGQRALSVSGCITVEVDNAMHARNTMPPPVPAPPSPYPWPQPKPKPMPGDAPTVASSADFGSAPALIADQTMIVGQRREAHKQAAETMERFQASSLDVYNTVPQFSPPKIGPKPPGEENPPAPPPRPEPPPAPQPTPGPVPRPPGGAGRGGGSVAVRGGGAAPVGGPVNSPVTAAPQEQRLGAGPGAGREVPPGDNTQRPAASAGKTPGGGAGMAGMPMGMGAGQKQEDQEHKRKQRIKEDNDIWGLGDEPTSPPVIGEGKTRA